MYLRNAHAQLLSLIREIFLRLLTQKLKHVPENRVMNLYTSNSLQDRESSSCFALSFECSCLRLEAFPSFSANSALNSLISSCILSFLKKKQSLHVFTKNLFHHGSPFRATLLALLQNQASFGSADRFSPPKFSPSRRALLPSPSQKFIKKENLH